MLREETMAVAKIGSLTTRTNNTDGELTMNAGHGIATGNRLDLYWTVGGVKGSRRGVVVGTVATNQVPITGGSGDNLPADESPITAQVPVEKPFSVVGNNVAGLAVYSDKGGQVVIVDGADVELASFVILADAWARQWWPGNGEANPLSGDTATHVFFSHGSSAGTSVMRIAAIVDD